MDGFHFADAELRRTGRHERKGAPDTFDRAGYAALLHRLRTRAGHGLRTRLRPRARGLDRGGRGGAGRGPLVVTEGNYLLLWSEIRSLLDVVWYLDPPAEARRGRR